jgi:threonine/homoserine/homoserine lactone efflux protein
LQEAKVTNKDLTVHHTVVKKPAILLLFWQHMISSILQGITLGLVLAMMIGPVFFMLLHTSIKKGFRPAAYLAAGVALSDVLFIAIAVLGSAQLSTFSMHNKIIGWTGGLLLIAFGLFTIFRKARVSASEAFDLPDDSKTLLIDTAKGFMMNCLNPFVLIFWLGVAGALQTGRIPGDSGKMAFFISVIITVFSTDLLKAYLASRLKKLLTGKFLLWLNRIAGTGLVFFGIRLLTKL